MLECLRLLIVCVHFAWRFNIVMVFLTNVVALEVALMILDQRLEVEVWQFVHHLEHDVLQELVVKFWRTGHDLKVASVLRQAAVHDCIVLVVCVHECVLQPLVVSVAHEALPVRQCIWAVHLAMAAEVWAERLLLADRVLHEAAPIVHDAVDRLAAHPLVRSERCLVHVHDLIPGAHQVLLFELLLKWLNDVTDNVLLADFAIVDRLKSRRRCGHC